MKNLNLTSLSLPQKILNCPFWESYHQIIDGSIMAELIPWAKFEEEYAEQFLEKMGAPAKPFRMALGALIIKEKLRISDRENCRNKIKEKPLSTIFYRDVKL